jgi:hypothetical protein
MLEVLGKNNFREEVFIDNDKADSRGSPSYWWIILGVLFWMGKYVQELIGLFKKGRDGSIFAFVIGIWGVGFHQEKDVEIKK